MEARFILVKNIQESGNNMMKILYNIRNKGKNRRNGLLNKYLKEVGIKYEGDMEQRKIKKRVKEWDNKRRKIWRRKVHLSCTGITKRR